MKQNPAGAVITGMGAICPIGNNIALMCGSLISGDSGIAEITTFSTEGLRIRHAAQIQDYDPSNHFGPDDVERLDRTAQLAIVAARQAAADAGLSHEDLASGRTALVMGICAGGIGDGGFPVPPERWSGKEEANRIYRTAHHLQTQSVAASLGVSGPCYTVSTACASSTSALATALTLIESGRADTVVVGGADAYSLSIYAGFYSLGAMSEQPTSPFSVDTGATFGEGAGCIVIESEQGAARRMARVHGKLLACGTASDAHHITSPHPGGDGLRRAMQQAIADAGLTPSSVQYINAHGTGTLDNDIAETLAIRAVYHNETSIPPVSSSKSYFGHTLGGAGILEFIAALLGQMHGFLPATLNFKSARPGCDLDYVPNVPRPTRFDTFVSTSAAFGGVNAVAVGASADTPLPSARQLQDVVVTGLGTVSSIGLGINEFRAALQSGKNGIVPINRFDTAGLSCHHAGLVAEFSPRKLVPTVDVRRMDNFTRFAIVATAMALEDAGLAGRFKPERVGLHVAMARGPVTTQQAFQEHLADDGIAGLSARYFPSMVLSTVSGQIAQACQIKGASFTFVEGASAGLQALAHGRDYLALHPELDALIVVAVDEVGPLFYRTFDYLGLLADGADAPAIYAPDGAGVIPGEGAVAIVLERADFAGDRGAKPYGRIDGIAFASEGCVEERLDQQGRGLEAAAREAIGQAGAMPDVVYGMARGVALHDMREANAVRRLLGESAVPLACLNGQLGFAEAASGLFAASAALLSLRHGEAYPSLHAERAAADLPVLHDTPRNGTYRRSLVLASNDCGNSAAMMLSSLDHSL
ncbi:putative Beta-ketoacyl synthase [Paraburkholderia ribeironis]|uniref:Putative Beta-ketoacyl synthase n=1 Tax=Paraburkholderia ribeironis TaxID=1247936 RepID=A0A1N7S723_9BURK|nr:beta-ketoacyl-[acyl-carrier-protein] synthase family protein [Paraburkholderia ribeironis]SIT43185.1 putative Beta-ketoacyl synthase [Paraburkholderia ribeironis]